MDSWKLIGKNVRDPNGKLWTVERFDFTSNDRVWLSEPFGARSSLEQTSVVANWPLTA